MNAEIQPNEEKRGTMQTIWFYFRLYLWCFRANWLALMAYPVEFIITNLSGVAYSLGSVASVWVLFTQVKSIGDWNYPQVLLIYGMSIFSRSLFHLFWVNFMTLSGMIRMGEIDRLLVRPLNAMFQVLSGYLDNDDWGELATAIILVWTSLGMLGQRTAGNILWVLLSVISGSLIFASMHIVGNSMAFFTVESSGFSRLAWTVDEFTRYPADIYGKGIRTLITWVIPVAFASFYPAQLIFGNGRLVRFALATPFVAALTFMAAYAFWTRAMNRYQGVGN
ncbi:MAG: ABC transporter permease [Bacillota bacterium]|jgi:ABC-2 type transport system permease protein